MEIWSEDRRDCITLIPVPNVMEPVPHHYVCGVEVTTRRFSGRHQVILDGEAARDFVNELVELEKARVGRAVLSGNAFWITLEVIDRTGHIAVTCALGLNDFYIRHDRPRFPTGLRAAFMLDPSTLPQVINDYRNLLKECGAKER